MRPQKLSWRSAVRLFGTAEALRCAGCNLDDSSGQPWYIIIASRKLYCPDCAAKVAVATDAAMSRGQFYANTRGTALVA
jgi:hypothetical protein